MSGKREAIESAASVAKDIAEGRLSPADLERQALEECRALFGKVSGPDDPLWPLHVDIARQVLAFDGVPFNELTEWVAVHRQRPVADVPTAEDEEPQPPAPTEPEPEPQVPVNP